MPTSAAGDSRWVGATAVLFTILVVSGSAPPDMSRGAPPTGLDGRLRSAGGPALPCVPRDGPCATRSPAPGAPVRAIHRIQGAAHRSPLNGRQVSRVAGVVTAVDKTGFWLQDPRPDDDPATSEALYVATGARPGVSAGDAAWADGRVSEVRSAGPAAPGRTQVEASALGVTAHGRPLPAPVTIGGRGRRPPDRVIDDDARGDLETSGEFQPLTDGADFFESLEGMRVRVDHAVAIGPADQRGVIPILADGEDEDGGTGDGGGLHDGEGRTRAYGLLRRADDPNPERLAFDDALAPTPVVNTGDRFPRPVTGVLDHAGGEYAVLSAEQPPAVDTGPGRERARPPRPGELSVATLNVHNLDPGDAPDTYDALARQITDRLHSPDLITVAEIQDNSGGDDDGTVAADQTVAELINAISAAGGPPYYWRSVDPRDNADGGPPGGNIRVGFLYHTENGLDFVHRPGAGPDVPTVVTRGPDGRTGLTLSPGRIDPGHPAFTDARKPLAAEFRWRGRPLIAVANHWSGTGLDDPAYGRRQPPRRPSDARHRLEADRVGAFVRSVHAVDRDIPIVVAGDLNTADYTPALRRLGQTGLVNAARRIPAAERYTRIDDGNAIAADHVLLNAPLARSPYEADIVHANADYAERPTDRDQVLVRLRYDPWPVRWGHARGGL